MLLIRFKILQKIVASLKSSYCQNFSSMLFEFLLVFDIAPCFLIHVKAKTEDADFFKLLKHVLEHISRIAGIVSADCI